MSVFFNDTATTEIYTLSLHDALPIFVTAQQLLDSMPLDTIPPVATLPPHSRRSEEHTSELQSRQYLVCRLLLEKKKHIVQLMVGEKPSLAQRSHPVSVLCCAVHADLS